MDSFTNNLVVTILIGILLAILIHYLACPEPVITDYNNNQDNILSNKKGDIQNNNQNEYQNNTVLEGFSEKDIEKDTEIYDLITDYNQHILEDVKENHLKINQLNKLEVRLQKMKEILEGFENRNTLYNTNGDITNGNITDV
tara:strand:+ start:88 stop:513 length:426 start_codon:yes stop_codon:yes gene_type:complete